MDYLFDDSKDDKLIEDYLFSGYKPSAARSAFERDQQFAKPIQDEDLFGCDFALETQRQHTDGVIEGGDDTFNNFMELPDTNDQNQDGLDDFDEHPFGEIGSDLLNTKNIPPDDLFDDNNELNTTSVIPKPANTTSIDTVPEDDCSSSKHGSSSIAANCSNIDSSNTNNENTLPSLTADCLNYSKSSKLPSSPTSTQTDFSNFKEKLRQQAKAMGKPQFATGFKEDGTVQVVMESSQLVSDGDSKFIFNNIINKSKKYSDRTPEKNKRCWNDYRNSLTKRICAEKRKVWDSFQHPVDEFDEEEEFVEPIQSETAVEQVEATDDDKQEPTGVECESEIEENESDDEQQEEEEDANQSMFEDSNDGSNQADEDSSNEEANMQTSGDESDGEIDQTRVRSASSDDDHESVLDDDSDEDHDIGERIICSSDEDSVEGETITLRKAKIILDSDEDD